MQGHKTCPMELPTLNELVMCTNVCVQRARVQST